VIKKNIVIVVIVGSCLAGIYWFSTPAERDRWLAVLGLSEEASNRVGEELARRKREAAAAKEAARARAAATAAQNEDYAPGSGTGDACQSYREQAQQLAESGQAPDDHLAAKIARYCDYR
jgi:hypothetical protein